MRCGSLAPGAGVKLDLEQAKIPPTFLGKN
jgi:hypothetical protein